MGKVKDNYWEDLRSVKLEYDEWDNITRNNLLSSYSNQYSELLLYSKKLREEPNRDYYHEMVDEARTMMDALEKVIDYYFPPGEAEEKILEIERKVRSDKESCVARAKLKMMGF
jgi:hypothetical protein